MFIASNFMQELKGCRLLAIESWETTMATSVEKAFEVPIGTVRVSKFLRPAAIILLSLLSAVAIYAHVRVVAQGDGYTGGLAIFDRLFDLLLALAFLVLAYCVGRSVAGKIGVLFDNTAEELAFSIILGIGVLGLSLLGLGLIGGLRVLPVIILLLLLAAVCAKRAVDLQRLASIGFRSAIQSRVRLAA